jgi:hypothetical protein
MKEVREKWKSNAAFCADLDRGLVIACIADELGLKI